MTATEMIKPEDRYDSDRIAEFRANDRWRGGSLAERLEHWSREQGGRTAVSDGYGELTWSALHGQSHRLAARLREMGIEPGDRVHVQLPSWNEFVVIYAALTRIGAVLVPSMPIYRWDEVRHATNHAGATR